jgi:hypothetical protein
MKLKLWHWEYEFDRGDAEIVIPLILLILGLTLTPVKKDFVWYGGVGYYVLYFFLIPCVLGLKGMFAGMHHWWIFRCPYCKSREVFLQGYQGYHSDEQFAIHLCNRCRETSVLVNDRLIKANL